MFDIVTNLIKLYNTFPFALRIVLEHYMAPILEFVCLRLINQGIERERERELLMFWEFVLKT